MKKIVFCTFARIQFVVLILLSPALFATNYYIDPAAGNNANPGTSPVAAFAGPEALDPAKVRPGDSILFARGTKYNGSFQVEFSGNARLPVVISAYGEGGMPALTNPDGNYIIRVEGNYITISGLHLQNTTYSGVFIGGTHCEVKHCKIEKTGFGIQTKGNVASIHDNHIHDLHMIKNTEGGDDDYGAAGILVGADTVWIYDNIIENCIADSYDYGVDGGILEFYGDIEFVRVFRNIGRNSDGFFEVGGGTIRDVQIYYNLMINNGEIGGFHMGGKFGAVLTDFRIINNTVYDDSEGEWQVLWFHGRNEAPEVELANNIICYKGFSGFSNSNQFRHSHNLLHPMDDTPLGSLVLDEADIMADPGFMDAAKHDFRITEGSPAIDAGKESGYTSDFSQEQLLRRPDMGALEFTGNMSSVPE